MSNWDKSLLGLFTLALIAVVARSSQTSAAVNAVGASFKALTQNIVGIPSK